MPRFFAEITQFPAAIIIGKGASRHIKGPLRKKRGDEISIRIDMQGYRARITAFEPEKVYVDIEAEEALHDRGKHAVFIAMSLIDMKEFEDAIRAVTELGITGIHPIISSRSSIRTITHSRFKRWETIILEAVKQCERKTITSIHQPVTLHELINKQSRQWSIRLVAHKDARHYISEYKHDGVGILIGPEGGFSSGEMELITSSDFIPVSMGNTILRAATAATAAASFLVL